MSAETVSLNDLNMRLDYSSLEDAFPSVDPGCEPFGDKVLVQIRRAMTRTKSGLYLAAETRDTELWNTQVAKIIAVGPAAFRNRDTLEYWPEGPWAQPGMFVRCPKYGGDRWEVPVPGSSDPALFVIFRDLDLGGRVPEDRVLDFVAYVK